MRAGRRAPCRRRLCVSGLVRCRDVCCERLVVVGVCGLRLGEIVGVCLGFGRRSGLRRLGLRPLLLFVVGLVLRRAALRDLVELLPDFVVEFRLAQLAQHPIGVVPVLLGEHVADWTCDGGAASRDEHVPEAPRDLERPAGALQARHRLLRHADRRERRQPHSARPGLPFLVEDDAARERVNESQIHIDFMIGAPELTVTGITRDGDRVPVLVGGTWQV